MIRLIHGDAEREMAGLERVFALAYVDPPFNTGREFRMGDEVAFDDRWPSLQAYVAAVSEIARDAWALLRPGGSVVVHLDPKTSHYVKVALDGAFGRENFASEIVWRYRRWPSKQRNFQRVHDVLLRYVQPDAKPRWVQLYEPLSASTLKHWGGKKQVAVFDKERGKSVKANRKKSSTQNEPSPGCPMGDVWEFPILAQAAKERTGYPTQKPESVLERLISATTEPGDWVLDPTCGSGTTLAVAARLGRHAVGIDSSPVAIRVASERLAAHIGAQEAAS